MRPAKRKAVVQQNAPIRDVDALHVDAELFPEAFPQCEIKRRVRLEMVSRIRWSWIAVREARRIVNVRRSIRIPRQSVLSAEMQSVALVVVEKTEAITKGKIRQTAIDITETERQLIRIGQVNLCAIANARRTQRQFPAIDARALNRDGNEEVGIVEIVVVEEIPCQRLKIVGINRPPVKRNGHAELVLLVALAMQRHESQALVGRELEEWT